jgi:hypothetical protein
MDWIDLAQDIDQWSDLVNKVMNLRVPKDAGNFLNSCMTGDHSSRAQLHGVSYLLKPVRMIKITSFNLVSLQKAVGMYGAPTMNRTYTQNFQNDSFNIQPLVPYESYNLFESAPRYGLHHNLLFQVRT